MGTAIKDAASISTVAVVEDDFAVRNALAFSLQVEGFSVRAYECAEDALRDGRLAEIDCFVIDYRLPSMDGVGLLEALRSRGIGAPAVLIASTSSAAMRAAAAAAGAPVIDKPLIGNELFDFLRAALPGLWPQQPERQ